MSISIDQKPKVLYRLEFDHSEQLMRAVSAVTIDPAKSILYYFIPWLGAYLNNQLEVRKNDQIQTIILPESLKDLFRKKVEQLKTAAKFARNTNIYTSLNFHCTSYGGSLSFSSPAICVPLPILTCSKNYFSWPWKKDSHWIFTSDEVSFFIAREIAHIQTNDALVRIAAKVLFIATLFLLYAIPISWVAGASTMFFSTSLYLYSERSLQGELDSFATTILGRDLRSEKKALAIAKNALEKLRQQNLERRVKNGLCRFYITPSGNNMLDLNHPYLTSRIQALQERMKGSPS